MDWTIREVVQYAVNGGVAVIIFVIWAITVRNHRADIQQITATLNVAFEKHATLQAELIQLLKDEQEYKLQLTGTLDRLAEKLTTPAQCPVLLAGKTIRLEVAQ